MAFVAIVDNVPLIRKEANAPGNTGGGNPRPPSPPIVRPVRPKPGVTIRPKCTPRTYAYPKHTRLPVGPFGRGRYHLLRYACLRSTTRLRGVLIAARQLPVSHPLPLDDLPIGLLDRNPTPVSGKPPVPYRRATGLKNVEVSE